MASAQQSKPDSTQLEVEVKGDANKWINSVKESSSLIESCQEKREESDGFLHQTGKQMRQLAQEATTAMKNAMAKKNDDKTGENEDLIEFNPNNDPSFREYRP